MGLSSDSLLIVLFVLLPIVCLCFVAVFIILCCSKRFRLNWFERNVLDESSNPNHNERQHLQPQNHFNSHSLYYPPPQSLKTANLLPVTETTGERTAEIRQQYESPTAKSQKQESQNNRYHSPESPSAKTRKPEDFLFDHYKRRSLEDTGAPLQYRKAGAKRISINLPAAVPPPIEQIENRKFSLDRLLYSMRGMASGSASVSAASNATITTSGTGTNSESSVTSIPGGCSRTMQPIPPLSSNRPPPMRKRAQSLAAAMFNDGGGGIPNLLAGISTETTSSASLHEVPEPCEEEDNMADRVVFPKEFKRERRRASMQDAIDATKINADMYTKLNSFNQMSIGSIQEENLGQLQLTLDYNKETCILTVRINQAIDLVPKNKGGSASPYCRVAVLPNRKNQTQTHIRKETLHPEFEEEFLFEVRSSDWAWSILEVTLFDYDQFSQDECLGQVKVPLVDMEITSKTTFWKPISSQTKSEKGETNCGDLLFSLAYLRSAKRLTVALMKARNLPAIDKDKHLTDAHVKLTLSLHGGKKIKKKKTSVIKGTLNPEWNEAVVFNVAPDELHGSALDFVVMADGNVLGNSTLGTLHVGHDSGEEEYQHWFDMVQGKGAMARWHHLISSGE